MTFITSSLVDTNTVHRYIVHWYKMWDLFSWVFSQVSVMTSNKILYSWMKFRVEISRGKLWVANQMQVYVPTLPHRLANVVTLHLAMSKQLYPVLWPYFFNHANCGKISKKSVTPNSFTYDCVKASLLFNPYVPTTKWKIPPTSHSKSQHLMPFLLHHEELSSMSEGYSP